MLGWGRFLDEHTALAALGALVAGAGMVHALFAAERARGAAAADLAHPAPGRAAAHLRPFPPLSDAGDALAQRHADRPGRATPRACCVRSRAQLALALTDIEQGRAISQAMAERGLTTPVALRMLRVGERSGRMSELMERIAAYFEDDLARWVEWFTRLFEPILMLLIGGVIGAVVLLLYMPILELAGALQ